jgi:hypothetical protein
VQLVKPPDRAWSSGHWQCSATGAAGEDRVLDVEAQVVDVTAQDVEAVDELVDLLRQLLLLAPRA